METFSLSAGADLITDLANAKDPVRAVVEMIWNGLDADANAISVTLERNDIGGVSAVRVEDDGDGMLPERLISDFRIVGQSWKQRVAKTPGGRTLHGKAGRGRIRAFALGTTVRWESTAEHPQGVLQTTTVTASATEPNRWTPTTRPADAKADTGTVMIATGRDRLGSLDTPKARQRITQEFAPYLLQWSDVTITYDGRAIDPTANITDDVTVPLTWQHAGQEQQAELRIIQWATGKTRTLHLCDADSITLETIEEGLPATDFTYSAYLSWDRMSEHRNEWALAELDPESLMGQLLSTAHEIIRSHFRTIRDGDRKRLVETWVAEDVYPYQGTPTTDEERIERATFDVVATAMHRHVTGSKNQRSLVLHLLRDNLQSRPEQITKLLRHYAELTDDEAHELDYLITETGLPAIIRASRSVLHRLHFLHALELLVYEDPAAQINERDHLHRILERELWVFGEQYNMMASERGLTTVLQQHLNVLRPVTEQDPTPVKTPDGRTGRVDLMLSGKTREHQRIRHLVVELKAPHVVARFPQQNQIRSYAATVAADPRFQQVPADWDFVLVTTTTHPEIESDLAQEDRPRGLVSKSAKGTQSVRVWIRTWSEIIHEARDRLDFYQNLLKDDPGTDQLMAFLDANYSDILGNALNQNEPADSGRSTAEELHEPR